MWQCIVIVNFWLNYSLSHQYWRCLPPESWNSKIRSWVIFFNSHSGWWSPNWVHSVRRPLNGLLYLPRVPKYSEKTCPGATLSTTNPTWDPGLNPGRRGWKPATNRLSYGAATVMSSVERGKKNDCSGEDQQQFTRPTDWRCRDFTKTYYFLS
jgi:hypothetical protein